MSQSLKKYSIVEFPDGLQIIPSCWINTQTNESIWPGFVKSQQALDKLLRKAEVPKETDKWDLCKIKRFFYSAATWERAQEKLVKTIDTSTMDDSDDFSENEWQSRQKKQRRDNAKKIYSDHSSETDEKSSKERHHKDSKRAPFKENFSQLPLLPKPPAISLSSQFEPIATTSKTVSQTQCSDETRPYISNESISSSILHSFRNSNFSKEGKQSCNVNDIHPNDFRDFMMKSMITLLRRTKNLEEGISFAKIKEKQAIEEHNEEEFAFPFETEKQLLKFEEKLKNSMFFNKMTSSLAIIGGKNVNVATNAILKTLITNNLAAKYSWQGRKGKKIFSKLRISKLILKTVRIMCEKSCTDVQIIDVISAWLAQAVTRLKRAEAKAHLQEQNLSEDDEPQNNIENIEN